MIEPGKTNGLNDVDGLRTGHYSNEKSACGVTVVLCEDGAVAGVDVRGAAPGTRETDLLSPQNLVQQIHTLVLSGGSVFGLAAADGVVRWLSEKGIGFPLDDVHVAPIVPAAVLYDLGRGEVFIPAIDSGWGRSACENASGGKISMGCVGAGTGALSGNIKGGLGTASAILDTGITVAALVAVNSLGSVVNPATGRFWEVELGIGNEFGHRSGRQVVLPPPPFGEPAKNTSIGVVATDAVLTKVQAQKIAQMAHDGLGRAIRPCHTMFDGDALFCMSTGKKNLSDTKGFFDMVHAAAINEIGHAAADCVSRAVIHAILNADSRYGMTAFCDLEQQKH
ncbi:MAG: P1 family peptidase [Desulfobacteraceae bacterium]|nr:P1 family peptidase [Desulfobacteraceae bacterium]